MEQESNSSNRFIFSNDFYNSLSNDVENKSVVDNNAVPQEDLFTIKKQEELNNSVMENNVQKENIIGDIGLPSFQFNAPKVEETIVTTNQEISDLVPLDKISEVSTDSSNNSVDTFTYNDVMPSINIDNNVNITNNDNEVKESLPDNNTLGVFVVENPSNLSSVSSSDILNNSFDVDSGINVDLEKEIINSSVQTYSEPTIIDPNIQVKDFEEKTVYRAQRNNNSNINNLFNNNIPVTNNLNFNNNIGLEEVNKPSDTIIEFDSSDLFPTPNVINIDEELEKESSLGNIDLKELMTEEIDSNIPANKSNLLDELREKEMNTGKLSILARYGEDFCSRDYVTNPAIGREDEINQLILILLTPEKSGILVGKPGIGKTSIVEGLAYRLQRGIVPEALKGYRIVSVKTTSLLGSLPTGETRLQTLIDELKDLDKIILFVDEIHMLMGATSESSLDFANMFKESLGRGSIKMIGATTTDEYERYVLRDKAFVRRFQRVDVLEPSREHTIKILMGTLPKIEKNTGAKLKYTDYIKSEIMAFIVDITTEYKRIYGIGSRYPDICLTLLSQAFSHAVFDNRKDVNILDIRDAIENSKNIYPDVIRKELVNFDEKFRKIIMEEKNY